MTIEDSIALYITDACNRKNPRHGANNIIDFVKQYPERFGLAKQNIRREDTLPPNGRLLMDNGTGRV